VVVDSFNVDIKTKRFNTKIRCLRRVNKYLEPIGAVIDSGAMGRPKKFNRQGVLERALPVFWKRGFADASLHELEVATGVNKSGLYFEFKDKELLKGLAELEYYHLNGTIYLVDGTQESLWSNLGMLLAEHNMSVLALHKRLQEKGVSVNLKSLYRLAVSQPLRKLDARIVNPICLVLGIDLSELISLENPSWVF
jgi:AcrR family transcriptional regulator